MALALLTPSSALARHVREYEPHHRHHFSVYFGYGPRYYTPYYGYRYGFYDRWGYWHPY